jgi:hypothetical protein
MRTPDTVDLQVSTAWRHAAHELSGTADASPDSGSSSATTIRQLPHCLQRGGGAAHQQVVDDTGMSQPQRRHRRRQREKCIIMRFLLDF